MRRRTRYISALLTLMTVKLIAHAQEPPPMALRTPATIIDSFIKTETQLRQSLNQHTFKRDVVLQTIGGDDKR